MPHRKVRLHRDGWLSYAWLVYALLASCVTPVLAQDKDETIEQAEPAPPAPIAVDQIISSAGQLETRLNEIAASAQQGTVEDRFNEQLATLNVEVDELRGRIEEVVGLRFSGSDLATLNAGLTRLRGKLTTARDTLGVSVSKIEKQLTGLGEDEQRWTLTRDSLTGDSVTDTVRERVADTLKRIADARATLKARQNAALDLQARLETQRGALSEVAGSLDTASEALATSMWVAQTPPIWQRRFTVKQTREDIQACIGQWRTHIAGLPEYGRRHRGALILHGAIILALGIWLRRARRTVKRHIAATESEIDDPTLKQALANMAHPWAAAVLVSLILAPFLQPERGIAERALIFIVAAAALTRVVWGMFPRYMHGPFIGLLALITVYVARTASFGLELLALSMQLVESLLGLWLSLWVRRNLDRRQASGRVARTRSVLILCGMLTVLVVAFTATTLATVLGYLNLANWILHLLCVAMISAVAWYAAVRIVATLLATLLLSRKFDHVRTIHRQRARTIRLVRVLVRIVGACGWAYYVLTSVLLWEPIRAWIAGLLAASFSIGALKLSTGGLLAFFLTLLATWFISRALSILLEEEVFPRVRLQPGVPYALQTFTRYTLFVLGFIVALAAVRFPVTQLALVVSALGVGIGFGLQNIINNFVSGVVLLFERPIRVGDRIQIGDLIGDVQRIGIRASNVRTFDGANVIVPNGDLISAQVTNWTFSDRSRRLILPVGVAYGTDPQRVLDVFAEVASANDEILSHPEPELLFVGFGESSLDFELRAWTVSQRGWLAVRSDLGVAVDKALKVAGIEIPFPQRDLHLRSVPPATQIPIEPAMPHQDTPSSIS